MRYVLAIVLGALIALPGYAAKEDAEFTFSKGPSEAQLKAKNEPGENWEGPHVPELKSFDDWEKTVEASNGAPILIFKHSTSCPVNAKAAYRVNQWLDEKGDEAPKMVFVKVIESKPVSKKIESDLRIKHESPQVLLLKDGEGRWSTSHDAITADAIEKALDEHADDDEK